MHSRAFLASTLALGASALLSSACKKAATSEPDPTEQTSLVNCQGINECKGKSACHTATHACAGQNSCKGDGWIDVSPEECAAKQGTVVYVTRKKP